MNHYEILEVHPKASPEVIKAAYKSLMQRHHPDRHPGDAQVAQRAVLISQAYEVLSDPNRRAAYDLELQQRATQAAYRPAAHTPTARSLGEDDEEARGFPLGRWLLVAAAIAVLGALFNAWSKKEAATLAAATPVPAARSPFDARPSDEAAPAPAPAAPAPDAPADAPAKAETSLADVVTPRTIASYATDLKVTLQALPDNPGNAGHVLSIPRLGFVLGAFDTDRFAQYIGDSKNRDMIMANLGDKLATVSYERLKKAGSTDYLKTAILDAMGEITGSNRARDYPGPPGTTAPVHYGVVDVLLPDPFSVE